MRAFQVSLGKIAAPFFAIIYFDKSKALSKRKGVSQLFVEDDFGSSSTTPRTTFLDTTTTITTTTTTITTTPTTSTTTTALLLLLPLLQLVVLLPYITPITTTQHVLLAVPESL